MSAQAVKCPHCKAGVGQSCHIGGNPLTLSAAHPSRLEAAGVDPDYAAVDRYRALAAPVAQEQQSGAVGPTSNPGGVSNRHT
jgi:hypothetical protein